MEETGFLIDDIDLDLDGEALAPLLHNGPLRSREFFRNLASEAAAVARPKAVGRICRLEPLSESEVGIGGVTFQSELLCKNTRGLNRAFPYVVTEGLELAAWAESLPVQQRIMVHPIRYAAVREAENRLENHLLTALQLNQVSAMKPGSLPQWPLSQQEPLFRLLSPWPERAGLTLLPTLMMKPDMSSSGLFFQTERKYHNCLLCPINPCPARRASYQGG